MRFAIIDIETRVDKELLRSTFYRGANIDGEEAYRRMREQLLAEREGRSDFFPISLHVPISIVVGNVDDEYRLTSVDVLGAENYSEERIVQEFWRRLRRFTGVLVSFNGRNFDLPVLELHALRHGCVAPGYFNEARGYRHRYAGLHYDLYDFLTNYGNYRIRGGFDLVARVAGLPGKTGIDGSMVQGLWEAGELEAIHRYCRRDVIQTYLLLLRIELMRGRLSPARYEAAYAAAADFRAELVAGGEEVPGSPPR